LTLTRWYAVHVLVLPAVLLGLTVLHLYLMRRHGISGPVRPATGRSQMFFPYQASRDLTMAIIVGVVLSVLAWMGAPALEPPADPTSSDYIPRPEWYFLGLFQLLKYFPGRLEVVGALVIPGIVMTWLALLPWLDRGRTREWRGRRVVLGLFTAGLAAITTLTILGARDRPAEGGAAWNIRELGGAQILATSERCTRCHGTDKLAAPVEAGRIRQAREWIAAHVNDPEVIAPGLRPAPESNQYESAAIVAALARLRASAPPELAEPVRQTYALLAQHCLECHVIDGVGGKEGPELTHVGKDADAGMIERRLVDPFSVDPAAEMPAFVDTLTPAQMRLLAVWLSGRK
jgi:ubiquinol-cytochrome c reductase cytochrome b subunit